MEWRAPAFQRVAQKAKRILEGEGEKKTRLEAVCRLLRDEVAHYNWVGFYVVDPEEERQLLLGPYSGSKTEHVKIAFGTGICGQAADSGETFVVQDVSREWNYLACSPDVKAEIVVPVFHDGKLVGEIDVDSHTRNPFTPQDSVFLEDLAEWVAPLLAG